MTARRHGEESEHQRLEVTVKTEVRFEEPGILLSAAYRGRKTHVLGAG